MYIKNAPEDSRGTCDSTYVNRYIQQLPKVAFLFVKKNNY